MIPGISLTYIALCFLVGLWNAARGNSFWTGFIGSLVLSPLAGAWVVGVTKKHLSPARR